MRAVSALLTLFMATSAHAAVLRVGPGEAILRVADAARLAQDGDTVEIMPGRYPRDVVVWKQKKLTIRGIGERPVIDGDGTVAEGKALWVIRDGEIRIENVEFRGARAGDGNGAGIRFERGRLHIVDCAFVDNQMGLLTAHHPDAVLRVDNSLFAEAPRQLRPLPHLLYVGRIARLELTGSRFHSGYRGHLVKSRARHNDIRYNFLFDGPEGEASYEIDLPNGGVSFIIGNIIGQGPQSQNPVVVAYGAEGDAWSDSALYLSHNTLLNERMPGAWFLRVWKDRLPPGTDVRGVNNLTVGPGAFTLAASGRFDGNVPALAAFLRAPEILDFSLPAGSILRYLTVEPPQARGYSLAPAAEFALPIGTRPIVAPERWAPGALQTVKRVHYPDSGIDE